MESIEDPDSRFFKNTTCFKKRFMPHNDYMTPMLEKGEIIFNKLLELDRRAKSMPSIVAMDESDKELSEVAPKKSKNESMTDLIDEESEDDVTVSEDTVVTDSDSDVTDKYGDYYSPYDDNTYDSTGSTHYTSPSDTDFDDDPDELTTDSFDNTSIGSDEENEESSLTEDEDGMIPILILPCKGYNFPTDKEKDEQAAFFRNHYKTCNYCDVINNNTLELNIIIDTVDIDITVVNRKQHADFDPPLNYYYHLKRFKPRDLEDDEPFIRVAYINYDDEVYSNCVLVTWGNGMAAPPLGNEGDESEETTSSGSDDGDSEEDDTSEYDTEFTDSE
jgi:hypothetical protein